MRITTDHAASSYGLPVILDDDDQLMDCAEGIREIRRRLDYSTDRLAEACSVSRRTVEGWEQGRPPSAAALASMADLLGTATPRG